MVPLSSQASYAFGASLSSFEAISLSRFIETDALAPTSFSTAKLEVSTVQLNTLEDVNTSIVESSNYALPSSPTR